MLAHLPFTQRTCAMAIAQHGPLDPTNGPTENAGKGQFTRNQLGCQSAGFGIFDAVFVANAGILIKEPRQTESSVKVSSKLSMDAIAILRYCVLNHTLSGDRPTFDRVQNTITKEWIDQSSRITS